MGYVPMNNPDKVEGIVLMSALSRGSLNERQLVAYENHRREPSWLARMGKSPDKLEGSAHDTAKVYANILDKFHRWAWERGGGYTLDLDHEDADTYIRHMVLAEDEYSTTYLNNIVDLVVPSSGIFRTITQ